MTWNLDGEPRSMRDLACTRAYDRGFWPTMVAYALALVAVTIWGGLDGPSQWSHLWTLLPVIPTLWTVRATVRQASRIDDHQRRLLLRGLALGLAVALSSALALRYLGVAGLPLPAAGWLIFGAGMLGSSVAGTRAVAV